MVEKDTPCYKMNCASPKTHTHTNSYVKTPTLNVNMLGNRALKGWLMLNEAISVGPNPIGFTRRGREPLETGHPLSVFLPSAHRAKPTQEHSGKAAIYTPEKVVSPAQTCWYPDLGLPVSRT